MDPMAQTALKYDVEVMEDGRVELRVPFPAGVHVIIFVVEEPGESFDDLVAAAATSLDFWNHPWDDEDWNHA